MSHGDIRVRVFGKTDLGRTRDHNEDTFLVADLTSRTASLDAEERELPLGGRGSLLMVADGMGGAAAGELASAMATDQIHRYLSTVWADDREASARRFALRMREAVEHANAELHRYAQEHPDVRGMGTTVTAAGILAGELFVTQIGDSRAYLVRHGRAIQLTKDQSLMQRLVDAGELTEEEAEQSERRNIILQALGPDARVKVDVTHQPLRRGDVLVLCSDGLSALVKKDEIARAVRESPGLPEAGERLIELANERGGPDNITVVLARFEGDGLDEPAEGSDGEVGYRVYPLADAETTGEMAVAAGPQAAARRGLPLTVALGVVLLALALMAALLFVLR